MTENPDSLGLLRLSEIGDLRSVWAHEAHVLTPWLAENLDLVSEAIGQSLTLVATEVLVGSFRLDISATDEDGRVVVIENQLEPTDHGHLGQVLLYAAGLEASTVIWISPRFRPESRRALEWLNERTDAGIGFYGLELGAVQIGEGARAPVLTVVVQPNDFHKGLKASPAASPGVSSASGLNPARADFFADVQRQLLAAVPTMRTTKVSPQSWYQYAVGPYGNLGIVFTRGGEELRVEAYLDLGTAAATKTLFDELYAARDEVSASVGYPLVWERLDQKRASRLYVTRPGFDPTQSSADEESEHVRWTEAAAIAFYQALDARLTSRARELRRRR